VSAPVLMDALAQGFKVIDSRLYISKSDNNISKRGAIFEGTHLFWHLVFYNFFVHRQCTYRDATRESDRDR